MRTLPRHCLNCQPSMPLMSPPCLSCTPPLSSPVLHPSHPFSSPATSQVPTHLKPLPTSTHHLVRWRTPQERTTSTSAMHVELDITSSALAWVRALLDSGLSGFGLICSVFVCLLIPLLVLDSSFVLLASIRRLLPSDTNPCHSLSTLHLLSRIKIPYIFASSFDHWTSLLHMTPCGLSLVALDFNLFLSFSPITPSLRSIYCRPLVSDLPYKYPSPAPAKARQLQPTLSPSSVCV